MIHISRQEFARHQDELMRNHRLLDAITEIQSLFIRDAQPQHLLHAMTSTLLRVTQSTDGFVAKLLIQANGSTRLQACSAVNGVWHGCVQTEAIGTGPDAPVILAGTGLIGQVLLTGQTVYDNAPLASPSQSAAEPLIGNHLVMPLYAGDSMVGLIALANRPGGYDSALIEELQPLVRSCAQIIDALRNERERFEARAMSSAILQGAGHAMISTDLQGTIRTFNPAAERMLGYTAAEMVGLRTPQLFHDPVEVLARAQTLTAELGRAIAPGFEAFVAHTEVRDVDEREWTYLAKDGTRVPVWLSITALRDATGSTTGYLGIANDLRERKQAQAQLHLITSELRAVVNMSPDGFVAFNEHAQLSFANPAFLRMCGCDDQALAGMSEADFDAMLASMCGSDKPYTPMAMLDDGEGDTLSRTEPRFTMARRQVRRLVDDQGLHLGRVAYFRDITRESELDRMKSEFLTTAAHELRTPVASLHGFSDLLLKCDFDPETRKDLLQTIHRQSSNLVELVNELLDLARIGARADKCFHMQTQSVLPIIDHTVRHLLIPGDVRKVTLRLASALPDVNIDADKLEQALLNVLTNAYKYSPEGGSIELSTHTCERAHGLAVGITVCDHGIGMTPEQASHIFERFYRADTSSTIHGTGLGMSLVQEIIAIHHGEVEIETRIGEGMSVTLWLPASTRTHSVPLLDAGAQR
jgi:PAS domain S-box-containing protein